MAYGTITVGGKTFTKRPQEIPVEIVMPTATGETVQTRVTMPGIADFYLMYLKRQTVVAGVATARLFKFKFGNSDGNVWYSQGGIGGTTDRVLDTLMFGNGQFPYVLNAPIIYSRSGSILIETEDVSLAAATYTIFMSFSGAYLLPQ